MAVPASMSSARVNQAHDQRDELIVRAYEEGFHFADFFHQMQTKQDQGQTSLDFRLWSNQATASIVAIIFTGTAEDLTITLHLQPHEKDRVSAKFLQYFALSAQLNSQKYYEAVINRSHHYAVNFLTHIGRYNRITNEAWSDFKTAFTSNIPSTVPFKVFYAHEISTCGHIRQVLLISRENYPVNVNFIDPVNKSSVILKVSSRSLQVLEQLYTKDLIGKFTPSNEIISGIAIRTENPDTILTFFNQMFDKCIVPESARTTIRDSLSLVRQI